jgi:hypothetical protein
MSRPLYVRWTHCNCRGGHGRSPQYYSDDDGSAEAVVTSAAHIDNAAADEASAGLFEKIEVTRLQHRANGGARTSLLSGALAAVKSQEHSDATAASAAASALHDRYYNLYCFLSCVVYEV